MCTQNLAQVASRRSNFIFNARIEILTLKNLQFDIHNHILVYDLLICPRLASSSLQRPPFLLHMTSIVFIHIYNIELKFNVKKSLFQHIARVEYLKITTWRLFGGQNGGQVGLRSKLLNFAVSILFQESLKKISGQYL